MTPKHYKVPNKLGIMAGRSAQLPKPAKFVAQSASAATFVDFREQARKLADMRGEELRAYFDRFDVDRSGFLELRELPALLGDLYGMPEAPERVQRLFDAYFDDNRDGRVSWDEFVNGVERVRKAMAVETKPKGPPLRAPAWVGKQVPNVIGPGERKSAAMAYNGEDGDDPATRPLAEGSGMASTTKDLFEGTSKQTLQLPGYGGFIPIAAMGSKFAGKAVDQASGSHERDTFHAKTNLTLTVSGGTPGYTGHISSFAAHMTAERVTPAGVTEKSHADQPVLRYWASRNAAAAEAKGGSGASGS